MICEVCKKRPSTGSAIINEIYYRSLCRTCKATITESASHVSSGAADYDRGRDAEEHEADYIQPFPGNKPSSEFIHLYPEQAKAMMTPEEIDRATRT